MALVSPLTDPGPDALDVMIAREEASLLARTTQSQALHVTACASLAGGVASSWQDAPPCPVWISHGKGPHVWDVDGNEYVDLHAGFGTMVIGHAHPAMVAAVNRQVGLGTHFAQPTPDLIPVSVELARRFGLPLWRFANSGTEATMAALHLMRATTGRQRIIKVEGSYHGHHDAVQVSVYPETVDAGPPDRPRPVPEHIAVSRSLAASTHVVPFGRLDAVQRILLAHPGEIAGMIIEPVMMNIGVVPPPPGFLQALADLLHAHGALLTFDEVKTGLSIASGGAVERFGVVPDIVCLAKALGGGVPCGAIGGTAEVMQVVVDGTYDQVGTFNGNPLTVAAMKTVLLEILTPAAYAHFDELREAARRARPPHAREVPHPRLRERVRCQRCGRLLADPGAQLPRLLCVRLALWPRPLAVPAQRRRVPSAVGEGRAVDAVGPAHVGRRRRGGTQCRALRSRPAWLT